MNKFFKVVFYPFTLILLLLVWIYKIFISPMLPRTCRFYPSCSSYSLQALKQHGLFKGLKLTIKRICRCRPNVQGGYEPVPCNIKGEQKWLF